MTLCKKKHASREVFSFLQKINEKKMVKNEVKE